MYVGLFLILLLIFSVSAVLIIKKRRIINENPLWKKEPIFEKDQKKTVMMRMESMLYYSGLMSIKWMNTETFLLVCSIISVLLSLLTVIFTKSMLVALIVLFAMLVVLYGIVCALVSYRDKSVEKELLLTMDMISAYSSSYSELVEIFEKVSYMLHGTLRKELQTATSYAKSSGKKDEMFDYLIKRIRYDNFQFLMDNLRTISKFNTDYAQVVDIIKSTIDKKIKSNQKIASIYARGRMELFLYMGIGIFSIFATQSICGVNAMTILTSSATGIFLLILYVAINIYMLYVAMIKNSIR